MPSSYTTNLRLELQATGENRSSWGQKANTVFELVEEAISKKIDIAIANTNISLSALNGATDQSRPMFLTFTGTLTAVRTVTLPAVSKMYIMHNDTTGGFGLTIKVGDSTYLLANGQQKLIFTDGITVFTNDTLASVSSSSKRWGIPALISDNGYIEAGRYIDFHNSNADATDYAVRLDTGGTTTDLYLTPSTPPGTPGAKLWNAGNDGAGSGLDADLVDGKHATELGFPTGTIMLFAQAAAPTGWTKVTDASWNDRALRVTTGVGGLQGGTVDFSVAFTSKTPAGTVGGTALTEGQLPSHAHAQQGTFTSGGHSADHTHLVDGDTGTESADHSHTPPSGTAFAFFQAGAPGGQGSSGTGLVSGPNTAGRNVAHSHHLTFNSGGASANHTHNTTISGNTTATGSGQTHTHAFTGTAINLAVKYVDIIAASKT